MTRKKKNSLKYGEARQKLEEILREIEGSEVDVDDLSDRVKEAAELIQICRDKLQKTRAEVEKVVSEMELDKEAPSEAAGAPGEDGEAPEAPDNADGGSEDTPF